MDEMSSEIRARMKVIHTASNRVGRVAELDGKRKKARVEWDDGGASWVSLASLERKVGRPPGAGAKVPKPPKRQIALERQFADVIREEMEKQNLTWDGLAERSGVNRSTIARLLRTNGERQWLETIEAIAMALGIPPSRFWKVEAVEAV